MIKVRMMGTPEELQQFRRTILRMEHNNEITILSMSGMYSNRDTEKYYRMYADVKTLRNGENNYGENKKMQSTFRHFTKRRGRKVSYGNTACSGLGAEEA